jgi:hypothetical protein
MIFGSGTLIIIVMRATGKPNSQLPRRDSLGLPTVSGIFCTILSKKTAGQALPYRIADSNRFACLVS